MPSLSPLSSLDFGITCQSYYQFREKSCATSPRTEVASHNVTRFLSAPKTFFQPTKNGNEQCFLKKLKSNLFFFYSRALALIHCLVFSSHVKRWQHQIIFVVSCQKKREKKKKKTRFVLKSQSCNYLNESSKMLLGETFISFGISSSQSNVI